MNLEEGAKETLEVTVEQNQDMYVLVEYGDGYYYGEPVAAFFNEVAAYLYKASDDRRLYVACIDALSTDRDGMSFIPDNKMQEYRVLSNILSVGNISVSGIISKFDVKPEDFDDMWEQEKDEILEYFLYSSEEIPEEWQGLVEDMRDEEF